MARKGWIEGDALVTLLALRPLQRGDRVKIQTFANDTHSGAHDAARYAGVWLVHSTDDDCTHPINLVRKFWKRKPEEQDWEDCCSVKHICAWKGVHHE